MRQSPICHCWFGEINPVKMLHCQGFVGKLHAGLQTGIHHEKGRERRQILQGEDIRVWNKFILIQSFWVEQESTNWNSRVLFPVLVLPLSYGHSQTHTDILHQQCILPPKHLLQQPQSLQPLGSAAQCLWGFYFLVLIWTQYDSINLPHSP